MNKIKYFAITLVILLIISYLILRVIFPGLSLTTDFSFENIKKIWQEEPPASSLTEEEKEELRNKFKTEKKLDDASYCSSFYFPFLSGSNWRYRVTTEDDEDVIKTEIPSPENGISYIDGRLESKKGWTVRTKFACENNQILISDINFLMVPRKDQTITLSCNDTAFNLALPNDKFIESGDNKEVNVCLINNFPSPLSGDGINIKEKLRLTWKAGKKERVELNAGTFDTYKLEIKLDSRQELLDGARVVSSNLTLWLTRGIGIVKSQYQEISINGVPSNKPLIALELEAFQIPTEKEFKR